MISYDIPMDEISIQELKDAKVLLKGKMPLYFILTTDLVDNIYITDYKNNNLEIGEVVIDYDSNMYRIFIYDNLSLGNMAIELLDQLVDQNLVDKQVRLQFAVYDDEDEPSFGMLTIKVGILGELQEDFYAAYFLGSTIRPYGYFREDYYKRNYDEGELEGSEQNDEPVPEKTSFFSRVVRKLFGRK